MSNWEMLEITEPKKWADILGQCRESDLQQTWAYGEGVKATIGWEPERRLWLREGKPVAAAQAVWKELAMMGKVVRLQHGPMFLEEGFSPDVAVEALQEIRRYYVDERGATLHFCPCLDEEDLPEEWEEAAGCKPSNEVLWASIRVDLSLDDEKLRKNLARRWRRCLVKAEEGGLFGTWTQELEDCEHFADLYDEVVKEKHIPWPSAELVRQVARSPEVDRHLVWVKQGEETLAGGLAVHYDKVLYGFVSWGGEKALDLNAQHCLIWESIQKAKALGCDWYDLGGIDEEELPGITKFKRATGGEEYAWAGNAEARPEGAADEDYRKGLGRVFPGLDTSEAVGDIGDIEEKVAAILREFVRASTGTDMEIDSETSLLDGGFLDSLSIVSIVQALQEAFDIQIAPHDVTVENFDKLPAICALVQQKNAEG